MHALPFICCRPLYRVATGLTDMGLAGLTGDAGRQHQTLRAAVRTLAKAILTHRNKAALRHADETFWRVQAYHEKGRSSCAWLWTSVSDAAVYDHIDPSRSAEVTMKLFGSTKGIVALVCNRLSTYKRLARELDGKVILQWCWRTKGACPSTARPGMCGPQALVPGMEQIAEIYRLNDARTEHDDCARALEHQTPVFDAAQAKLKKVGDALFAVAEAELGGLSDRARRAKSLRSLLNHREGLCVSVGKPFVPPDNNRAQLALCGAVIGRRSCFGSDSGKDSGFTARMSSAAGTLAINGIAVPRWMEQWLAACTENDGKPPDELASWLPWSMREERRHEHAAPE